jgi:hypothetical protein
MPLTVMPLTVSEPFSSKTTDRVSVRARNGLCTGPQQLRLGYELRIDLIVLNVEVTTALGLG